MLSAEGPVGAVGLVAVTLVTLWALAGCGDTYEQQKLTSGSEEFRAVQTLLDQLRSGGVDLAMMSAASGLTQPEMTALAATLDGLASAETVELIRVDAFGASHLRATFRQTAAGRSTDVAILLVRDDDRLLWAGRN